MYSLAWPNMINENQLTTNLKEEKDAIRSNLILLLNTEKLSLFGDPYFGASLKQIIFQPNNSIIVDLIIDEIYTLIITYIPQLYINRGDIKLYSDGVHLRVDIKVYYALDNTSDLYSINLTNNIQEG